MRIRSDHQAAGDVGDAHRAVGGVHRLAARPAGAVDVDAQILLGDIDIHLLDLGKDRHRGRRGVDATARFGFGHALDPVDPRFELEAGEDAAPGDVDAGFLDPAQRRLRHFDHLEAPAVQFGIALVHTQQVAREESRFVAAGARAHLQNGVLFVGLHAGGQRGVS